MEKRTGRMEDFRKEALEEELVESRKGGLVNFRVEGLGKSVGGEWE